MRLRNLVYLDLGHNLLEGTLPSDWWEMGYLSQIRHLYLNNNRLTGTIPDAFISIGNDRVNQLILNDNYFTGTFPGRFVLRNMLEAIEIQNNQFSAVHSDICRQSIFGGGEVTALRTDCSICPCRDPMCSYPICSMPTGTIPPTTEETITPDPGIDDVSFRFGDSV